MDLKPLVMNRKATFIFMLLLAICHRSLAQLPEPEILTKLKAIAVVDEKVMMPMRDGIKLATDIFRPQGGGKHPIIFVRTPYNFNPWRDGEMRFTRYYEQAYKWVQRGYAFVVQNERGRYFSQGEWDILGMPLTDGADALTWLSDQAWSNGKIATQGCSSTAEWQMAVAAQNHPAHAALFAAGFGAGVGKVPGFMEQGNWYRGGAEQMLFFSWLARVQNDQIMPRFPANATQEQLQRASKMFDLGPKYPDVSWKKALAHLPVKDIISHVEGPEGIFTEMITRKPNDPAWYTGGLYHQEMDLGTPALWVVTWFDVSTSPNLAMYNHIREKATDAAVRDNQYLIIAPTLHCRYARASEQTLVGDLNVGDARLDYDDITLNWYDHWLQGKPRTETIDNMPRVQYYTMGKNEWQSSEVWPPADVEMQTYYLHSEGAANTMYGNGRLSTRKPGRSEPADTYVYDPMNAVPSYGGNVCCTGDAIQGGSYDQRPLETRNDILVYTTEPLSDGVEVSGFIETTLYVSSDAKDTDFTVKLIDVYPDGRAFNLDETILRARYREGFDKEVMMEEGKVYQLDLSAMSTSNYFAAGHQIRIEVSSSNFPRFTRNMNTGGNTIDETEGVIANNVVHHTRQYPSQIRLPIRKP